MKKIFLLLLTLSLLAISCSQKSGITGTFTGLTNDTLWIQVTELNADPQLISHRTDTVVLRNGRFFYDPQTNNLTKLQIIPIGNIDRSRYGVINFGPGAIITSLFYYPGDHIRLNANNDNNIIAFTAKGNRYSEQLSTLNANVQDAFRQRSNALRVITDPLFDGDITVYQEKLQKSVEILNSNELNFIRENPDEPLSAFLITFLRDEDKVLRYAEGLGSKAKESIFGKMLESKIEFILAMPAILEERMRNENARQEMIGNLAPDFTLKDIDGNYFTLSSLRGKYVVLNFWGSWCGWCFVAFPEIIEYYTTHPGEFHIVGIAFRDESDRWRDGVERAGLPWINVIDDENNSVSTKYHIWAAPTYILIDKEGVIVDFPRWFEVASQLNELREKGLL